MLTTTEKQLDFAFIYYIYIIFLQLMCQSSDMVFPQSVLKKLGSFPVHAEQSITTYGEKFS